MILKWWGWFSWFGGVWWARGLLPLGTKRSFSGRRTPSWLIGPLQEERHRRLKQGVFDALMMHVPLAMKTIGELFEDPETPASVKADIAKFMYEQLHGKAAAQVNIEGRMDVRQMIAAAIVLDDGRDQDEPLILDYDDGER